MSVALESVKDLDRQDPLFAFKSRFALPEVMIYLDGNSLGAQPIASHEAVEGTLVQWRNELIKGWNQGWFDAPERLGNLLAPLIGAQDGEVVVTDNITLNIYKLIGYITESQSRKRPVILSEGGNFPTDGYIAQGFCHFTEFEHRFIPVGGQVEDYLDDQVAVVILSHVHYRTGQVRDMAEITRKVHACGAEIIWDLAHSAGALEVDLHAHDVRFAVGCTYKYLNGGPGAPGFLYVSKPNQNKGWQPLTGWHGHAAPFAFDGDYAPASGMTRFRTGTHSALIYSALEASLALWQEVNLAELRAKSLKMTELFRECIADTLQRHSIEDITPPAEQRGSQVSLINQQHGYAIVQALIERGVIGDYREPGLLRFGFTPLYLSYEDVWQAAKHFCDVVESGEYQAPRFQVRSSVT
ncbi:kynureninase [Nitrincola sp. MINF-07-Sa-05]|uniref:kynureninase n=1 Tax=Nitrincola salilacus TaxID=3400273 RepID=UPI003917EFBA